MAEIRDDVPLADLEEQQRDLDTEPDVTEGDDLPETQPRWRPGEADEADVVEQWQDVRETEDYPPAGADEP
jgi:hypothetical protein